MLFPYSLRQFNSEDLVGIDYYIPQGNFVFALDETAGLEKFYLIASVLRLSELEDLYGSYEAVEASKKPDYI